MKTQHRVTEFQSRLFNFRAEVKQRVEQLLPMYFDKAAGYISQPMLALSVPLTFTHCSGSGYITGIITAIDQYGYLSFQVGPRENKLHLDDMDIDDLVALHSRLSNKAWEIKRIYNKQTA
jgi:hypothetical protein